MHAPRQKAARGWRSESSAASGKTGTHSHTSTVGTRPQQQRKSAGPSGAAASEGGKTDRHARTHLRGTSDVARWQRAPLVKVQQRHDVGVPPEQGERLCLPGDAPERRHVVVAAVQTHNLEGDEEPGVHASTQVHTPKLPFPERTKDLIRQPRGQPNEPRAHWLGEVELLIGLRRRRAAAETRTPPQTTSAHQTSAKYRADTRCDSGQGVCGARRTIRNAPCLGKRVYNTAQSSDTAELCGRGGSTVLCAHGRVVVSPVQHAKSTKQGAVGNARQLAAWA
jgi:hypothetical protein